MKQLRVQKRNGEILKRYLAGESIESLASSFGLKEYYIKLLLKEKTSVPRKYKDLTGRRQGRLTFRMRTGKMERGQSLWLCDCDCGGTVIVPAHTGRRSCGCLFHELGERKTRRKRNAKIGELYQSGKYTLRAIGERYGLSRQRVHQIIGDFKPPKDIRRSRRGNPGRWKRRHS